MRRAVLAFVGVAALAAAARGAEEEDAVRIYREVQGCVVALENLEGSGTGIVLDRSGLILTNAHVVASPLPFKCKADLALAGKTQTVTYKRVKTLGVHPTKDLAVVQIDTGEHKGALQVPKFARKKGVPGQRVFAIGNPSAGGGMVLNKTITAGLLSGVDRVIDGVAYYQISAPINPGNSGGPLVNLDGEVIGLVTLKFTDAENVGFAIPLADLNLREFIPLSKRKGDPREIRELVEHASEFYDRSRQIAKQRGLDDPEAQLLSLLSAKFYHMALAQDPGNDGLYYNVGMLLRGLDLDDVAAAYLLQAIQLNPWGSDNGDYYRELGFALVKQKKSPEARVAWEEGIAKYPVSGAKIWEDLIIFRRNEEKDMYGSAYSAAVVRHLADPNTRVAMAEQLFGEARKLLDENDRKRLDAATAKIGEDLRDRQLAAQRARMAGKPYLTEAFAQYVENSGTLGAQDQEGQAASLDRPIGPAGPMAPELTKVERLQKAYELLKDHPDRAVQRRALNWHRLTAQRTWTDSTGQYSVTARYLDHDDKLTWVKLETEDAKQIQVPFDQLGQREQTVLRAIHSLRPKILEDLGGP